MAEEAGQEAKNRLATLRAERDRRRRERDEARQALAQTEATRQEEERRRHQAEAERDETHLQAQRQGQRIARLERQVARLQAEQTSLLRALKRQEMTLDAPSGPDSASPRQEAATTSSGGTQRPGTWQNAVTHLLDKRLYDLALDLAEDVLRVAPNDITALDIAARAQASRGEIRSAVTFFRRRLTAALTQGARTEAGESLLRLLILAPSERERDMRAFLVGLRTEDTLSLEGARSVLTRLRSLEPKTHTAVAAIIGSRLTLISIVRSNTAREG